VGQVQKLFSSPCFSLRHFVKVRSALLGPGNSWKGLQNQFAWGSGPGSATYQLCDLGKVRNYLCTSISHLQSGINNGTHFMGFWSNLKELNYLNTWTRTWHIVGIRYVAVMTMMTERRPQ
jgi:hypothetical protein